MKYAELHCISNFSFLRGASHPEELVARAKSLGYSALAITDECSLAGAVRAHVAAKQHELKLIIGSELRLSNGPDLVLLAADREGYGNLCELMTRARRAAKKGAYQLARADLASGLAGCLALLLPGVCQEPDALLESVYWLTERFCGRSWIAVELLRDAHDHARLAMLRRLSECTGVPLVAAGNVHMHVRSRRVLQDTLTAIRLACTIQQAGHALCANGEQHLRSRERLSDIYPEALLRESIHVAEQCSFSLNTIQYEYPEELVPRGETPTSWLRRLTEQGMRRRWPGGAPDKVREMLNHELDLIAELGYEPFFLTVHDLVQFARSRGILCQGRGSAANSAVCYCLGVTEVDPARMAMLFERFVSKERNEPPDIDVDFEHERREEVVQHIYRKYGRERAALAATVVTYRPRSAIRDVGKALGMELAQIDRIAKSLAWWDGREVVAERFRENGIDPESPVVKRLIVLTTMLQGFPRHLSQHVGGFVIANTKLSRLVPIENAAMPERTVIQWDKDDLEALGMLKVDVLALGMLTAIHRALDLVSEFRGRCLTIASVPAEDPRVYEMVQQADTVGVFQIESRAQMAMLPRLRPRTFYDLVIEVAIVRPGPIQGGMVHPYLRRRRGLEPITYPSQAVRSVLERTLGVPIFQEQVMQLAVVAAGFSPGEADRLRRAMAAWKRRGGLGPFEERLFSGMKTRGYSEKFARQIYKQIQGFGEYGFPESHSASFALLVYVSAWLKCHEPAAFCCALLNSQPMGFYAPAQLIQDAVRHGVEIRPVDIRRSGWDCSLERTQVGEPAIRLGFRMVKGFSQTSAERLVAARAYIDDAELPRLASEAQLNQRDLRLLAFSGSLKEVAGNRHQARWQVLGIESSPPLLAGNTFPEGTPMLPVPSEGQALVEDYAVFGFTLGPHPLALLRHHLERMRMVDARQLQSLEHGQPVRTSGLVVNRQRPSTASGVVFITLEDETGHINLVLWPWVTQKQRAQTLSARLLGVDGVVERDGDVIHVVAKRLEDHSHLLGRLTTKSRDFH